MRKLEKTILLAIFALLLGACSLSARNTTVESMGVKITAVPGFSSRPVSGYCFYSVVASNLSANNKEVRLSMRSTYSGELEMVSKTFRLAPHESRIESLFFPTMDFSTDGLKVEIDGYQISDKVFPYLSVYRDYYRKKQALVDNRLSRSEFESVFGSGHSARDLEMSLFDGSLTQLSSQWLNYTQFNSMIFYSESLKRMSKEVRNAIFDYVRAGGILLLMGDYQLPADFVAQAIENPQGVENVRGYECGFGRVIQTDEDVMTRVATGSGNPFPDLVADPLAWSSGRGNSPLSFNDKEVNNVSTQWLMIIIYAFAFLIGPVNVYILHKLGRKIWVFWTVPVASAICCFFIFSYYWLFESSTLLIKKRALTLLDQRNNHAVTLANLAVYSASSRPDGFKFSYDTEVRTIARNSYRSTDGGKIIKLDEEQHLAEGWIRPKIPRYMHLRKIHLCRERLSFEKVGGEIQVLNGLGARIKTAFVMTDDGRLLECNNVDAGQKSKLFSSSRLAGRRRFLSTSQLYQEDWNRYFEDLYKDPGRFLKPGMYVALLDGTPFLRRQSFEKDAQLDESVVIGITGGEA